MLQTKLNHVVKSETIGSNWKGLCKLGGIAALIAIPVFLLDMIISFGGGDVNPDTLTAIDWFELFQRNGLLGLRMLGLINIISLSVTIPLYYAIYAVHRQGHKAYATLSMIMYLVGVAIYISNNAAIPMFVLSSKYFAATTEAQRAILVAAGEAIAAKGADFTPGSFIGFFFTELAGIAFSFIILKGRIFSKAAAYSGILGFSFLTVFTIWITFVPAFFEIAMIIAMIGGLSSMIWYILVGLKLLHIGLDHPEKGESKVQ